MGGILLAESVSILHQVRLHHKPCLVAARPRWVYVLKNLTRRKELWMSITYLNHFIRKQQKNFSTKLFYQNKGVWRAENRPLSGCSLYSRWPIGP